MVEENLTPEEKLLRIIEAPKGAVSAAPSMRARRASLQDFKLNWKFIFAKYSKVVKEKYKDYLNLRVANFFLISLCVCATVYIAFDFPLGIPRSNIIDHIQSSAKKFDIGDLSIEELAPLSIFTQEITQRNIFALPESAAKSQSDGESVMKQTTSEAAIAATADLKLVGIIWSDMPQAMIEDSRDARTYLVSRGNSIKDARVKEILKDRVVLSYDNQEVELR